MVIVVFEGSPPRCWSGFVHKPRRTLFVQDSSKGEFLARHSCKLLKGGDPVDARRPRRLSCDRGKSSTLLPGCWGDDWAIPCTAIRAQPRYKLPSRPAKSYGLPVGKRSRRPRKATRWLPSARSSRGRRGA